MIVTAAILYFCYNFSVISAAIYGVEINAIEEWWKDNYFIKFHSPSGKDFYIDFADGKIYRAKEAKFGLHPTLFPLLDEDPHTIAPEGVVETTESQQKEQTAFISFVSIDQKIYDIHFESQDQGYVPRIEQSKYTYDNSHVLIRFRLKSFVGPNKKVYSIIYDKDNNFNVTLAEIGNSDHLRIKTFGPYEKWEHTYDFSDSGEFVTEHFLSPVEISSNRFILLPEVDAKSVLQEIYIKSFIEFNTPSKQKYLVTSQLNIVPVHSTGNAEEFYIKFTEPDGRSYNVVFRENDHVIVENKIDENYFGAHRLHSFVGPNGGLYRINHKNETDHEVPILEPDSSKSVNLQVTILIPYQFHNQYIKYEFSKNGAQLFNRHDEIDWTPLNEQPALSVEEVAAGSVVPFLSFHSPSGKNYLIITNQTNASIVVAKGVSYSSPFISFFQSNGKKANIYFSEGEEPYLEEVEASNADVKESFGFTLLYFVAPDRKKYYIKSSLSDENKLEKYIELPSQVIEPIDEILEEGLAFEIQNQDGWTTRYRFTWSGDKLVEALLQPPRHFVAPKVLQSLVGK